MVSKDPDLCKLVPVPKKFHRKSHQGINLHELSFGKLTNRHGISTTLMVFTSQNGEFAMAIC